MEILPGVRYAPGYLDPAVQREVLDVLRAVIEEAPL